jgi:hypothetical protein
MKRRGFFGWIAGLVSVLFGRTEAEPWSIGALARTPAEDMAPMKLAAMHVSEGTAYDAGPFRGYPTPLAFYDMSALNMTVGGNGYVTMIADCSPNFYELRKRDI